MQQTLFGFEKPKTSLKISPAPKKQLTKVQKQFNQLIAKVEKLQKSIPQEVEKYENLLRCSHKYVLPALEKVARSKIQLAMDLDNVVLTLKYKKNQIEQISWCIEDLLEEAFTMVEPTGAEKELYARWVGTNFDEVKEQQYREEKMAMEDLFEEMFGMEIDLEALKNDPEKMKDFQQKWEEKEREEAERTAGKKRTRQNKKAQSKKEALARAEAEMKTKSVRSLYISLAKLIHPDTEADPEARAAKEEEMKKVSAAYEANDLATLLKMEMEWIHKHNNELGSVPEEKLQLFVQVLRDQVKELQTEKDALKWDPKYASIAQFTHGRPQTGIHRIKKEAATFEEMAASLESVRQAFRIPNPKKQIMAFVKEYLEEMEEDDFVFFY